ncbi:MAG: flagellar hook-basal body protein [Desulfobacteraceae bacterium]|nr:MAG: flagellar hook-basal body protein [Desulfobacteraceae bacterium]
MLLEMTRPVQGGLRQERKLEAVANHLANADTTGFKRDVVSFDKTFKAMTNRDFSQGPIQPTGNPLDVAIAGQGLFKIETPDGIKYTRNGNFTRDGNGTLVDQNGNPVLGQGGAVQIEGESININEAGEIFVDGGFVDTLDIVTFEDLTRVKKDSQNNLTYDGDTQDEVVPDEIRVKQMALEGANIAVVDEMVRMIDYHRMYEIFQKSMQTFDEVDGKAINDVGKLT